MNILEVILTEVTIYQDTKWEKKGLDWNELPDAVSRLNNTPNTTVVLAKLKADLDAWRKANPRGTIEQAWTYLGGKGPAPEPVKEMPARDLRIEPPEDNAGWIDFGDKWQNTKMTPTGFALKPNPDKPNTWGPNWMPAADAIKKIKKDTKGISNKDVETKLRALTTSTGQPRYSDKEIKDGWASIEQFDILHKMHNEAPKPKWNKWHKRWDCGPGWKYDPESKACIEADVEDEPPEPAPGPDGKPTCPAGWKFDDKTNSCVKTGNKTSSGENEKEKAEEKKTPEPVTGPDGKKSCEAPFVYDPATNTCVNKSAPTPPAGDGTIIFPAGNPSLVNKDNPFGSRDGAHRGLDIGVGYGTKIVAPEAGEIIERKTEYGTEAKTGKKFRKGAGLYMILKSQDGKRIHKFMHLSASQPVGTELSQGELLGFSGGEPRDVLNDKKEIIVPAADDLRPGNAKGIHLHWEVWVDGVPVDPLTLPQLKK
jgi:hypothetical protein